MGIARDSVLVTGSRVAILVITTLTGIVLNRTLGADGRGVYVLATVLALTQLQNLVALGIQVSNQVLLAKERDLLARLHSWVLALSVAVVAVIALAVWIFWVPLTRGVFQGIAPLHLILVTWAVGPSFYWMAWTGLMIGLRDLKTMAAMDLSLATVQNGVIVVVLAAWRWFLPDTPWRSVVDILVVLFVVNLTLAAVVMALLLRRHGRLLAPLEFGVLRQLMSFGSRVYAGNYASGLLTQLDQLFINAFAGFATLGVYNQAASLANKVWMVSAGIESASYAPVSGAERNDARRLTVELFRVTLWISIALIVVGWVLSPLIPVIYGAEFQPTVFPFRILILGTALFGCGRVFSMYFTGQKKSPQTLLVLNWCLLPVHANLCFWLIRPYGVKGACIATTLTYSLSMFTLLVLFIRDGAVAKWSRFIIPQPEDWQRLKTIARRLLGKT